MKHIILIGFMGCGKTRTGRALARELGLRFVDMDKQIVTTAGMAVADIFAQYGEQYFRKLENKILKELLASTEQTVISTGGGVPMQAMNQQLLKAGIVVYLEASIEVLLKRLANDRKRPILQGGNLRDEITTLMDLRNPIYEQLSDITVSTSNVPVEQVVRQIVEKLVEKNA